MPVARSKCQPTLPSLFALLLAASSLAAQTAVDPHIMGKVGQVDPRYVSFNVESVEVTGGRFWKPLPKKDAPAAETQSAAGIPGTGGSDPYQYRPPIDLSNPKLRKLASALAPSYMRVSGTWRNSAFFQDDDKPVLADPPKGFKSVLTRAEWKGVVDFAKVSGADLVTSVAVSDGTRDAKGEWTPDQAAAIFDYTKSIGGRIAATEFMNEPTFASLGAAPAGYDAGVFGRDVKTFGAFLRAKSPGTIYLGPGSIGEGIELIKGMPLPKMLNSEDLMKASGPAFDAFSYHFYTTLSTRCVGKMGLGWEKVLTPEYLDRNPEGEAFYAKLRDADLPGKPIWLTETGEAACGGDRWAAQFVDAFRFADQLGVLAQKDVQTVMVNTLAASDYGLLDEGTMNPRPDYWLAVLWKRLMGNTVLDPAAKTSDVRLYAQCSKEGKGGVTLLALNIDRKEAHKLSTQAEGERYTLTAADLLSDTVRLNDVELAAGADGSLPGFRGVKTKPGELELPPASITFVVFHGAKNAACR